MERTELAPVTDSCECRNIKFEMAGSEITSCFSNIFVQNTFPCK